MMMFLSLYLDWESRIWHLVHLIWLFIKTEMCLRIEYERRLILPRSIWKWCIDLNFSIILLKGSNMSKSLFSTTIIQNSQNYVSWFSWYLDILLNLLILRPTECLFSYFLWLGIQNHFKLMLLQQLIEHSSNLKCKILW